MIQIMIANKRSRRRKLVEMLKRNLAPDAKGAALDMQIPRVLALLKIVNNKIILKLRGNIKWKRKIYSNSFPSTILEEM